VSRKLAAYEWGDSASCESCNALYHGLP